MSTASALMTTDEVSPRERVAFWADWIHRLFGGLESDLYGDTAFDGRMTSAHAGDVILTRLEANRQSRRGGAPGSVPASGACTTRPRPTRSTTQCALST